MKQISRIFAIFLMAMLTTNTFAETTTVGSEDNTSGFWKVFSDYYTIKPEQTQHLEFVNYSSKSTNWDNWIVVIATDADRSTTDYSEYAVVRCDNWGWNSKANTSDKTWYTSLESNYNWDTFKNDMDGSTVVMNVSRSGAAVTMNAAITTTSGGSYYEKFVINCGDGTQNIRIFLTTELGHLVIDNSKSAVTAIRSIEGIAKSVNGNCYSLGGQQMTTKSLPKGIYIKNGEKFMVR